MPLVRPVSADAAHGLIEVPTPTCYLCGVPWQDGDALVILHVHAHTTGAAHDGTSIPQTDLSIEFGHEGCAQQQPGYQPLLDTVDALLYGPTWAACCGPALAVRGPGPRKWTQP